MNNYDEEMVITKRYDDDHSFGHVITLLFKAGGQALFDFAMLPATPYDSNDPEGSAKRFGEERALCEQWKTCIAEALERMTGIKGWIIAHSYGAEFQATHTDFKGAAV